MTHTAYQAALQKIRDAPMTLTEYDFSVLDAFNPADEQRGRDAVRRAQIAMLPTTAATPAPDLDAPAVFADAIETSIRQSLRPLVLRLRALEAAQARAVGGAAPDGPAAAVARILDERLERFAEALRADGLPAAAVTAALAFATEQHRHVLAEQSRQIEAFIAAARAAASVEARA